jgi:hypothetical protein
MTDGRFEERSRQPMRLKEAMRQARIELAARSGGVVDLHDAALARLEMLNEGLDPVFADIPAEIGLFDRGLAKGDPPRLWVDMIAHVEMARDKRTYRFLLDTRFGRQVLAETGDIDILVAGVTTYVARRLVERERALAGDTEREARDRLIDGHLRRQRRRTMQATFVIGMVVGMATGVVGLLALAALCVPH